MKHLILSSAEVNWQLNYLVRDLVDQLPENGEASSDLANPHVLYRKVIEYVGAADQLANLSQEVPYLHN